MPTVMSISNDTSMRSSNNDVTVSGAVGGVLSFMLVVVLCIVTILYVRHRYKRKKAYLVNHVVHYKPNKDIAFYPNLCYDTTNEVHRRADTAVDNDYNIITNSTSATNAGK